MARPREFNADDALDRAVMLFWKDGYTGASLNKLLEVMDIQRSSFYNTFGDKRQLFMQVLARYAHCIYDSFIIDLLDRSGDGLTGIQDVFDNYLDIWTNDPDFKGCLIVNTLVEFSREDEEISALIDQEIHKLQEGFCRALGRAQACHLLEDTINTYDTARFLVNTFIGMHILAHHTDLREKFEAITEMALSHLTPVNS